MSNSYLALLLDGPMQSWGLPVAFSAELPECTRQRAAFSAWCARLWGWPKAPKRKGSFCQDFPRSK